MRDTGQRRQSDMAPTKSGGGGASWGDHLVGKCRFREGDELLPGEIEGREQRSAGAGFGIPNGGEIRRPPPKKFSPAKECPYKIPRSPKPAVIVSTLRHFAGSAMGLPQPPLPGAARRSKGAPTHAGPGMHLR